MREPKPSDVQALHILHENIRNISANISRLNGELIRLYKDLGNYINEETGETVNVQATHGSTAGEG